MKNLSRYIDHTLLKADATENEVIKSMTFFQCA